MNEWWGGQPDELKQAFSLFPDGRWEEADLYLRINIRNYCLLKKGGLLPEDKERSMLIGIVCELADTELCRATGKALEDMCDTEGAFLEEYQEQFNRIYDELEMRITDYMNGQSKKDVAMKAKVFKYKSDGNTVVAPYMELEPYAENVYLSLSRKNEYGNEDDDCFHVVCRIENVYFSSGQYSRRFLKGEGRREEAAAYCRSWIADTLQGAEKGTFVKLLSIRVFEALGLDTTPLVQAREAYKRKQEQKRREQEEKEAEERRAREEQHQRLLDEQKQKFLDGERITGGMFLEITGRDGFDIHIRTKGTFNRHVRGIDRNGTVSFRKIKGCRTPDFTGCHKAVSAYLAFITEKEGK